MTNYTDQLNEVLERLGVDGGELPDNLITTKLDCILANMDQLTQDEAPAIVPTSTGTAITLNDSSDKQIQSITVYGNSTQDGTPTLENPIDIVSVGDGGSVDVTVCSKNKFSASKFVNDSIENGYPSNLISNNGENTITICATGYAEQKSKCDFGFISNTSYSIKGNVEWVSSSSELAYFVVGLRYTDETIDNIVVYLNDTNFIVTSNNAKSVKEVFIGNWGYSGIAIISDIQLEMGTATTYEPYKEQTITIELDEPLRAIGTYKDSIVEKDGVIGVERNIVAVPAVFRTIVESEISVYAECLVDNVRYYRAMNKYFKSIGAGSTEYYSCFSTAGRIVVILEPEIFLNVNELNEIIEGSFLYATILTPTFTPLPAAVQEAWKKLKTYYPITNIINSESANMSINYVADTKTYIDNATA